MKGSWLQLNSPKTEVIFFGSKTQLAVNPMAHPHPPLLGTIFQPAVKVKTLDVLLDSELSLRPQINAMVSACLHCIRQLQAVIPLLAPRTGSFSSGS